MLNIFINMRVFGLSANLMSLGAIDLATIVGGAPAKMARMRKPTSRGGLFCVSTWAAGQKTL